MRLPIWFCDVVEGKHVKGVCLLLAALLTSNDIKKTTDVHVYMITMHEPAAAGECTELSMFHISSHSNDGDVTDKQHILIFSHLRPITHMSFPSFLSSPVPPKIPLPLHPSISFRILEKSRFLPARVPRLPEINKRVNKTRKYIH